MERTTDQSYIKWIILFAVLWIVATIGASAALLFQKVNFLCNLAALVPLTFLLLGALCSKEFRNFIVSCDATFLTHLQAWRIAGFVFIMLWLRKILPPFVALPAGIGDVAVGILAPFAASRFAARRNRAGVIAFQVFGILDLVVAIGCITLASPPLNFYDEGLNTGILSVLPLSFIPTVLVPMFLSFHIVCIAVAWTWGGTGSKQKKTIGRISLNPKP